MEDLKIISYHQKFHKQFKQINLHWLKKFELYEDADNALLDFPEGYIQNGATIFLAQINAFIVGTICVNPINNDTYEILKLAVIDDYKGFGIGNKLLKKGIDLCKHKNAETILLESSSKLRNALKLYEKFGFKHIEIKETYFITADVKMELKLK